MQQFAGLVLAAGKGTRMKSRLCKVLHPVAGRAMGSYVLDALSQSHLDRIVVVVGHQADAATQALQGPGISFVNQDPQLGTGHAALCAASEFEGFSGSILILAGDVPLIRSETLAAFMRFHDTNRSRVTVMTARFDNPTGYGRIVRSGNSVVAIVEEKDATPEQKELQEINTGIYVIDASLLYELLPCIGSDNAQQEYYLTDVVSEAVSRSIPVHGFTLRDPSEVAGINTRAELARANRVMWDRIRDELMDSGVTLLEPSSVYADSTVRVGPDTIIHPGVTLSGETRVGQDCVIESGCYILHSTLADRVTVLQGSRLDHALVDEGTSIGPMAHLRPEAKIGRNARIGNFVEVKKTVVGDGTKAAHLTYLGDSLIGRDVNIGCGTITCNYDGKHKHVTVIGDRCFVGSDVQFVAPVEVGEASVIGAGSTITKDVPPSTLAVSRARQQTYPLRRMSDPDRTSDERAPHAKPK